MPGWWWPGGMPPAWEYCPDGGADCWDIEDMGGAGGGGIPATQETEVTNISKLFVYKITHKSIF